GVWGEARGAGHWVLLCWESMTPRGGGGANRAAPAPGSPTRRRRRRRGRVRRTLVVPRVEKATSAEEARTDYRQARRGCEDRRPLVLAAVVRFRRLRPPFIFRRRPSSSSAADQEREFPPRRGF
ncbi:unnamed protein product, partial [Ectocarpus sp. 12 AP-2014]